MLWAGSSHRALGVVALYGGEGSGLLQIACSYWSEQRSEATLPEAGRQIKREDQTVAHLLFFMSYKGAHNVYLHEGLFLFWEVVLGVGLLCVKFPASKLDVNKER